MLLSGIMKKNTVLAFFSFSMLFQMINGKSLSTINADLIGRLQKYIQGFSLLLEYEENLRKIFQNMREWVRERQLQSPHCTLWLIQLSNNIPRGLASLHSVTHPPATLEFN